MKNDETLDNHPPVHPLCTLLMLLIFFEGVFGRVCRERNSSEEEEGRPHPTTWFLHACVTHSLSHLFNPNVRHREEKRERRGERNQIEATTTFPTHPPNPPPPPLLLNKNKTNKPMWNIQTRTGGVVKENPIPFFFFEKKSLDDNNQTSIIF